MKLSVIDRWGTHPLLVKVFAERIKEELKHFSKDEQKDVTIIFSAHSLPLKVKILNSLLISTNQYKIIYKWHFF